MVDDRNGAEEKRGAFLRSKLMLFLTALIPIVVLIGMIYWFATKGANIIETSAVPIEKLDFERIILHPEEIIVYVRNTGPTEITIAQITVNEALWEASIHPNNVIPRLGRAA
ncbi:MAG TPA: hypothetical protein VH878_01060, partial [Thermodesulfobacteriota bacterium]